LDTLFERAFGMAKDGANADAIKVAVNYPDFWVEGLGSGVPVNIHLYRDQGGRFAAQTQGVEQGLKKIFNEKLLWTIHEADQVADPALGVRAYPTWFINGHRFRGVQSVNSLARFVEYETGVQP
jgi:hypothetical protein